METQLFEGIFFLLLYEITLLEVKRKKEENPESRTAA